MLSTSNDISKGIHVKDGNLKTHIAWTIKSGTRSVTCHLSFTPHVTDLLLYNM